MGRKGEPSSSGLNRRGFLQVGSGISVGGLLVGKGPGVAMASQVGRANASEQCWKANWIWIDGPRSPRNSYVFFRKTIDFPERILRAEARVTADSKYMLFVNGSLIGRGPVRSDPRWMSYDTYTAELSAVLRPGKNVVAAVVHHYGEATFSYIPGRGGFLFEASVEHEEGKAEIYSDAGWKAKPADCWKSDLDRMCRQLGFPEVYDANKEPQGWSEADFDDRQWQSAIELGVPPIYPWAKLVRREIPFLTETPILPERVIDHGEVKRLKKLVRVNPETLFGPFDPAVAAKGLGKLAYLFTHVYSPAERRARVFGKNNHDFRVWVNGVLVLDHRISSGTVQRDGELFLLRKGWNQVLCKIAQPSISAWEFVFALRGEGVEEVVYSVAKNRGDPGWMAAGPFSATINGSLAGSVPLLQDFDTPLAPETAPRLDQRYRGLDGAAVSWTSVPAQAEDIEELSAMMALEEQLAVSAGHILWPESITTDDDRVTRIEMPPNREGYLVLDFGREVVGYPRLKVRSSQGGTIDVGYSELLENGRVTPDRQGVRYADRYVMRKGQQTWQLFDKRAFRYMKLAFRDCPGPVELESAGLSFSTYPVENRGRFECSDQLLNRIWEVGRYTLQLNMEDAYIDCPWRERAQWWGDARVEALVNYYAFGDLKLVRNGLRQIAQSQQGDGLTFGVYPAGFDGGRLPDFTLLWIISLWDYCLFSGDAELVRELFPNVKKALDWFIRRLNRRQLLESIPYWIFIDWAKLDSRGEFTPLNCLFVKALSDAAQIAAELGDEVSRHYYAGLSFQIAQAINQGLWKGNPPVYADNCVNGQLSVETSQHSNSLAVLFDIAPQEHQGSILDYILTPGNPVTEVGSPYFSFYVLAALYRADRHGQALAYMRPRWKRMLDWGSTTWWELWQPFTSLCHAWSSGPTYDLSAEFLGVKPVSPGFSRIRIKPHPVDLAWARGLVPCVKGDIELEWKSKQEEFSMTLTFPRECTAEICLPTAAIVNPKVRVNGSTKLPGALRRRSTTQGYMELFAYEGGRYEFVVTES